MNKPDKKPPREQVRVNLGLDAELHRRLKIRAAEEGLPLYDLIEHLLAWSADKKLECAAA